METTLPKRIFQYEILDLIGRGPNGEVFKGTDSTSGSIVVVKRLFAEVSDDIDFRRRCHKQLKKARGLKHPNLATLYDIMEQDGRIVLVSEFVEGKSLEQILEVEPFEVSNYLNTALQMARGLQHLHEAELLHGNLHPSNILVTPYGRVKLTDFCLPRRLGEGQPELGGFRSSTVAYASPEEAQHEQLLPASDLFSIGAIYYRMLSSQLPFPAQSVIEITRQIINHRPEFAPLIIHHLPGEIVLLLRRLLSVKDDERCIESSELLVTLEAIVEFQQESREHNSSQKGPQVHRVYLLVSLITVLLVLIWSIVAKN